ncbi:MAG: tetratricopeptide repeat protein [Fibrobacteria bacterium]|nr:tetratricopeptide repeat protein [Fibrobacteria bacterium]
MKPFRRTALTMILALAGTSMAELGYTKTRYQQLDYFGSFGQNTPLFLNPGNITDADQTEIMLALYSTVNGKAGMQYVSGVYPFGLNHTIGASAFLNGATVDGDVDANGSKTWRKDAMFLGYGYRVFHWLTLGTNLSVLNFNNFSEKSNPIGADFGFLLNPYQDSKVGFLKIGAAVQNLVQTPGYDNTKNINFGLHWLGFNRSLEGRSEFSLIDYEGQKEFAYAAGAQYWISPNVALGGKMTREGFPMLTFAGNAKRLSFLRYLEVELDLTHDGISFSDQKRGLLWNVKLTSRIGPTREEVLGAKRYARLIREPEEAFQAAMKLYLQRRFLESAYAFGKVVVKYPTYRKVDVATYYHGKSFENMRMNTVAKKVYETGIHNYDASNYVPKYYYQLLNVAYKEGNWSEALSNYNIIAGQYAQSDVKADADYVMGQAYFAQDRNGEARKLLESIGTDDANYGYAQYTLGLIATKEGKLDEAQQHFEGILTRQPRNKSERDLREAAAVKLGHVLYSLPEPKLTRAVELYSQVPVGSQYYDEAQLAAAWCFVRNGKWDKAEEYLNGILNNTPTSILVPETYLVRGYSQLQKKDCGTAAKSFQQVQDMLGKGFLTQEEIMKRRDQYSDDTKDFSTIQDRVYQLSLQLPSDRVLGKRDEVKPSVDKVREAMDEYFKFQDVVAKQKKFEKDKVRLENDSKYALATAQRCLDNIGVPTGGGDVF